MTEPVVDKAALRRSRQTPTNLVLSLLASLGIVLFLVLVVVRPETPAEDKAVDWHTAAAAAQATVTDTVIIDPVLGDDAWANRAELTAGDPAVWSIGWVHNDTNGNPTLFTAMDQYFGNFDVSDIVGDTAPFAYQPSAGISWTGYDRIYSADPGNHAWVWVTEFDGDTIVVSTSDTSENPTASRAIVDAISAFLTTNGAAS
ncbi:MAG: hypothetical protein RIS25_1040 [Actinomycetota bacterium]|jgi:hypothetical protein